jgi:hypothetical protein
MRPRARVRSSAAPTRVDAFDVAQSNAIDAFDV